MADITPVTREEFYLAKAGGQDVPVPSAVTREEHYLEKLSNDSVVVPSPITRREKFLYFACGGEIDLPSEDRMTRLERLIAKAGGMDVSTPTAVTRLEKFWTNVEGGWTVSTLTGTLPITFRSNGDDLLGYKIYGTAEGAGERTKNLISVSNVTADTGVAIVDADEATGSLKLSSSVQYRGGRFDFNFEDGKMYTISVINNIAISNARIAFRQVGTNAIISSVSLSTAGVKTVTLTFSSTDYPNGVYVSLICNMSADGVTRTVDLSNLMLVEGSSMLTDFIPYGYKLTLTVTSGTESKDADIYIEDSKLGASDYVDYETQTITRGGISEPAPFPLPEISTYKGTNILDSTETLGEVTIKGKIKEA